MQAGSEAQPSLLSSGCQILVPALLDRGSAFSINEELGFRAAVSHREWIYRQSFTLGRTPVGQEVQTIEAALDWMAAQQEPCPLYLIGFGEGGLIALHTAALDTRITTTLVAGYFGPREDLWREPIERNVPHLVREFGDAGVAALIAPRHLVVSNSHFPVLAPQPIEINGRVIAAPGIIEAFNLRQVEAEAVQAREYAQEAEDWLSVVSGADELSAIGHIVPVASKAGISASHSPPQSDQNGA